jgi:hypothetical protein
MAVTALPDLNLLPAEELRALILSQHQELISKDEQLLSREREIEHLKLLLAKLHRMQFGRKSEKLQRQIEQLELRLEELESNRSRKRHSHRNQHRFQLQRRLRQLNPRAAHYRIICRGKRAGTSPRKRSVRNARASYASWAKMCRRCWSTCPRVSWSSGMCDRS